MASLQERKNKEGRIISYTIKVHRGRTASGKQLTPYTSTFNVPEGWSVARAKKEAEKQAVLFERDCANKSIDGKIKFEIYAQRWLANSKPNFAPMTYTRYTDILKRVNLAIGHIPLDKIKVAHLQDFYNNLRQVISNQTKLPLSEQTVKHHHRCICAILNCAVNEEIIIKNVALNKKVIPKLSKKEPAHLDDEQARCFVKALLLEPDIRVKTALAMLLYSGVRMGELCGLEWRDINWRESTVSIVRTSQYCSGYGLITKEPKTESSKRTFKLSKGVFSIMAEYKRWYDDLEAKNKDRWIKSDRLFIQDDGKPILAATINGWLNAFNERNKLPKITPHSLRHTFITLLITNGVDVTTVAAKAGHSRTSTTLDIYTHATKIADEKSVQVLDGILSPKNIMPIRRRIIHLNPRKKVQL